MATTPESSGSSVDKTESDERPPILSSWNQIYAIVLILHAFIILIFYLFTHAYS